MEKQESWAAKPNIPKKYQWIDDVGVEQGRKEMTIEVLKLLSKMKIPNEEDIFFDDGSIEYKLSKSAHNRILDKVLTELNQKLK